MSELDKRLPRLRRQARVRRRVRGSDVRPRLSVFRSNRHTYVQVISDESGHTLASLSTLKFEGEKAQGNRAAARRLGEAIGKMCLDRQITRVVFDRNGFLYHGRVKEVADGARAAGLEF
jgi:large subunit ribosomal protein L18